MLVYNLVLLFKQLCVGNQKIAIFKRKVLQATNVPCE